MAIKDTFLELAPEHGGLRFGPEDGREAAPEAAPVGKTGKEPSDRRQQNPLRQTSAVELGEKPAIQKTQRSDANT